MKRFLLACMMFAVAIFGLIAIERVTRGDMIDLNNVNRARKSRGNFNYLLPSPVLMATAERAAQRMAREGRMRHNGGMVRNSREGIGYRGGNDPTGLRFMTCYHFPTGRGKPQTTNKYRYGGAAAVVGGNRTYYAIELSNSKDGEMRPMGKGGGNRTTARRGLFRRHR